MKSVSRAKQSELNNRNRATKELSQEPVGRRSKPMGNGSDLHSNLKMSSAEKVALDGIFKSLQVNKKPVVKEDKEETITLSRKQLNALIGTINEVCELVANEPLESFKMEKAPASPDQPIESKDSEKKKEMKENRKPKRDPPVEEKEAKKTVSKPVKASNGESILGLLEGKSKPVTRKVKDDEDEIRIDEKTSKHKQQNRQRRVSTVSKAVSPIIVFEKRKPAVESKRKPVKDVPMKKEKAKPVPAVVLQDSSGANTQRSIGATEEIIKTDRSFPSEIMTKLEKLDHVSPREIEPTIDQGRNSKEQPAAESPEPVHLTLLERKKLKWELEKRENSMLEKAITGQQPKGMSKSVSRENAPPRTTASDNQSRKSTADIKSPTHVFERPAAMLDHFQLANYNDELIMKRKEQKMWVSELEQQREQQLLKKLLDEELRRSCIIVTPRQASSLLAEVYEESKHEMRGDNHAATAKHKNTHNSENNALKMLVHNKVNTTFPAQNPVTTIPQSQYNKPRNVPEKPYQTVSENRELVETQFHEEPFDSTDSKYATKFDPKSTMKDTNPSAANAASKADESAQDAYNSTQTHLVFHQAFEQPVPITDRAKNDFGRFKALIDPSEVDRQRKERERQLEHMKIVQQQIEEKNREKERLKQKQKEEELEDEARIRRELAMVNNSGPSDYNRRRPPPPQELENHNLQNNPEPNQHMDNHNKTTVHQNPSHQVAAPPTNHHHVQRPDSPLNVDYVNHEEQNFDRFTEVKSLGEGNIGYTAPTPSVTRPVDKPTKVQLESAENLRQQKKEVLNKLRKQPEPSGKPGGRQQPQQKGSQGGKPRYTYNAQTRNSKSPPVPALQKNTLKQPANPARSKRLSAATHKTAATVEDTNRNETTRTQPTVISSRFVDPSVAEMQNERGFDTASQSQFVPFRRTSAHMDPAIQSSRPLASDYPDGHHLNYNNQQNDHSQQRQKAILQQLSTLRRGLMDKQREYDRRETPA